MTAPTSHTTAVRPTLDVRALPEVAFRHRDLVWWGTIGFMAIEGFTLALCVVVWIYLQQNMSDWPPKGTMRPSLIAPTVNMALMLLSIPFARRVARAAREFDFERMRTGMTIATLLCAVFVVLRLVELTQSLNVRWDTNAYGSSQWLVVGLHGTLLLMQLVETGGIAAMLWFAEIEGKHFSDADDAMFYWYFVVLSWLPLYGLCFVLTQAT